MPCFRSFSKFSNISSTRQGHDALGRLVEHHHDRIRGYRSNHGIGVAALIADAPNSSMHVVRDKERAVRSHGQARRAKGRTAGILHGAGKAIGKDDMAAGCLSIDKRLEHDVEPPCGPGALFPWNAIKAPRAFGKVLP